MYWEWILITILIFLSGFFSASETAFTSLSLLQIQRLKRTHPRAGMLLERLKTHPDTYLTTILIGNNLVNIATSALVTQYTIEMFGDRMLGVSTGIVTLVVLIFGEVAPKRLAIAHNEGICVGTVRFIYGLSFLLKPLIYLIGAASFIIARLTGPAKGHALTLEGLFHVVDLATDSGILDTEKSRMMKSILRFSEIPVRAIMTHRTEVFSLPADMPLEKAMPRILEEGYSRVPLYRKDPEYIVGILLTKEGVARFIEGNKDLPLSQLMRPPVFVSVHTNLYKLLSLLRETDTNLAIVLDEYGGVAGIVSYEDVLEEIVGEMYDEDDEREEDPIQKLPDGRFRVLGNTLLYTLNDAFDLEIPSSRETNTVAALIAELAGSIPHEGERITTPWGDFIIESIHRKRVRSVLFIPREGTHGIPRDSS
ncbi:MAG: hemolysin family protein [Spirochaetales bacterium]